MKKNQKKLLYFVIIGIFLNFFSVYSQSSNETFVYNWFDKNLGVESLDFENGPAHLNFDKTVNNNNRYYISEDFKKGNINYNGQDYFDLLLNYDTYNDEIVLKPYGESNTTKINIIKENVSYFKIGNERFIKLETLNIPNFRKGYYEEVLVGNNIMLFVKYYKEKKKINKDEIDLVEFIPKYEFVLLKDSKYSSVNTKKEILALFPNNKRKINDFYLLHRDLKSENPALFTKNLLKYINN